MRIRSAALGTTTLLVLLTAGAAQSLTGSNTVYSDDIVNGQVTSADIANGTVTNSDLGSSSVTGSKIHTDSIDGSKVLNNSLTGTDVNEASLDPSQLLWPAGKTQTGLVAFEGYAAKGGLIGTSVTYPIPLSTGPTTQHWAPSAGDDVCTGQDSAPTAPPHTLCFYSHDQSNIDGPSLDLRSAYGSNNERNTHGFALFGIAQADGDSWYAGSWAVTP